MTRHSPWLLFPKAGKPTSLANLAPMSGVMIRSYGEFWYPDLVHWGTQGGTKGSLQGEWGPKRSLTQVDVWDQQGIYVLHHEWSVVYIGKADKTPLGVRIRLHRSDHLAGKWDSFSWYGIRGVKQDGSLGAEMQSKTVSRSDLISTLEAILIATNNPPQNRRSETISGAKLVQQAGAERPRPAASYLAEIRETVNDLSSRLAALDGRVP